MACSDAVAVPGKPKPDWRERKETYLHHLETDADAWVATTDRPSVDDG